MITEWLKKRRERLNKEYRIKMLRLLRATLSEQIKWESDDGERAILRICLEVVENNIRKES